MLIASELVLGITSIANLMFLKYTDQNHNVQNLTSFDSDVYNATEY